MTWFSIIKNARLDAYGKLLDKTEKLDKLRDELMEDMEGYTQRLMDAGMDREAARRIVENMNKHLIRELDEAEKRYNKEFENYSVDRLQDLERKQEETNPQFVDPENQEDEDEKEEMA